jgi:protein TonB
MKEDQLLEYVSGYQDMRPRGGKRFLFWAALAIHAAALAALTVVPLFQLDRDLPEFESMATFLVRPAGAPPPPPPPPPPAAAPERGRAQAARARLLEAGFVAPVSIPNAIPAEDFGGGGDFGVPGGVEGGVPGGIMGGIVGGITDAPPLLSDEPVRLDFRKDEARPVTRVEPVYPDLAVQGRVQGVVILEVLVDVQGVPSNVNVLRSVPLLESAAIEAVRQWRWNPYKLLEKPVPFWVTVTVNFRLT